MDYETGTLPTIRWYQKTSKTTTEPPILQRLESGTGYKDGEAYHYQRWVDVELIIGNETTKTIPH